MIRPRRIGHATFETPDLDKAIAYYDKFMGLIVAEREKDRAYLATKIGQLVIELDKSDRAHCIKLSFEVAPNSDFGELAKELAKDGIRSELRNDSIPGIGQVLSFADDKGTIIELFRDWSYLGKHEQVAGIGPLKLGHVAFFTPDIRRTVGFYEKVLGFRVSDWIGDSACLLRIDPVHHKLAVFKGDKPGLCHMNFQVAAIDDVFRSWHFLLDHGVEIEMGPGRHPQSTAIFLYFLGPEGFTYEYSFGVRRIDDDATWVPRTFDPDEIGSIDMWLGPVRRVSSQAQLQPERAGADTS